MQNVRIAKKKAGEVTAIDVERQGVFLKDT